MTYVLTGAGDALACIPVGASGHGVGGLPLEMELDGMEKSGQLPDSKVPRGVRVPWLARRLGLSRAKAYALVASGELPAYRCGRALLVLEEDVVAFLLRHRLKRAPSFKDDGA